MLPWFTTVQTAVLPPETPYPVGAVTLAVPVNVMGLFPAVSG
jgi:hypothetical protein